MAPRDAVEPLPQTDAVMAEVRDALTEDLNDCLARNLTISAEVGFDTATFASASMSALIALFVRQSLGVLGASGDDVAERDKNRGAVLESLDRARALIAAYEPARIVAPDTNLVVS